MRVNIYSRPFQLTAGLENYIREKLARALSRSPYMAEVSVTVSDINGPRGGQDKQCTLQFSMTGFGHFVIKDTKSNLYHAIDSAVARARHAISRAMNRRKKSARLTGRSRFTSMIAEDETSRTTCITAVT